MGGRSGKADTHDSKKVVTETWTYTRGPAMLWAGLPFEPLYLPPSTYGGGPAESTLHELSYECHFVTNKRRRTGNYCENRIKTVVDHSSSLYSLPFARITNFAFDRIRSWLYVLDGTPYGERIWCISTITPSKLATELGQIGPLDHWPPGLTGICAEYVGLGMRGITVFALSYGCSSVVRIGVDLATGDLLFVTSDESRIHRIHHADVVHGKIQQWKTEKARYWALALKQLLSQQPEDARVEMYGRTCWYVHVGIINISNYQSLAITSNGRNHLYRLMDTGQLLHYCNGVETILCEHIQYANRQPRLIWRSTSHTQLFLFSKKSFVFPLDPHDMSRLLAHSQLDIEGWADALSIDDQSLLVIDATRTHVYMAFYEELLSRAVPCLS